MRGIAIRMASIGEGDYQVVNKRALCCSRSVCFSYSSESFEKFGLPPEKKLEEKSGPDPLLLTLPPPLKAQPLPIGPVASCLLAHLLPFAFRTQAGCRIACCCTAAARIHSQPLLFVCTSWLSNRISSHHLCLKMCRRLTTGCVVTVTNAQA